MSGLRHALWVLAMTAMLPIATSSRAAEKIGAVGTASSDADEAVDEPILLIPKGPAAKNVKTPARPQPMRASGAKAASAVDENEASSLPGMIRNLKPAGGSTAEKRALPLPALGRSAGASPSAPGAMRSSGGDDSPKRKLDGKIFPAASDEPTPVRHKEVAPATKSAKSTSASVKSRPVVTSKVSMNGDFSPPPLFEGPSTSPSPGPSRVARHSGEWRLIGNESGDSDPAPAPIPEGENVPAPESIDGDAFMPFDGDFEGDGEFIFDGDDGFMSPGRKWALSAGGEWLLLRPHFSQAVGMTETIHSEIGAREVSTQNQLNFNPGYQGAFRTYLGFRDRYCGDEVRFTFLNFNGVDSLNGTATSNTQFCDFLCNTTPNPGDSVNTRFNLGASVWDLDCIRPFYFKSPCNDGCGPQCHPWDLRWFGGFRVAYINHSISSLVTDARAADNILAASSASNKFTGFGLRMGLQARKFLGTQGRLSVYGRGAGSLLVGNDYQNVATATSSTIQVPTASYLVSRNSRIVPVAELEVGGTWFMTPRFAVSGGWMLMSFWDLGLQETGSMSTPAFDTSNILGFDGFFVRGELVF